jgi:methyltransferase (TIGR00027 family)
LNRRIESTTSRTAEMTCLSRACSALETNPYYKSYDYVAPLLLPSGLKPFIHFSLARKLFSRVAAPKGIYEYVIARTKYIDAIFKHALAEQFEQILIFGAGFDTRALRFHKAIGKTRVFELDVPMTQQAKIDQYHKRHLEVPPSLTFIAIDFDKESLSTRLDEAGFYKQQRSLFILEGLLMYLQPVSVDTTFHIIQD